MALPDLDSVIYQDLQIFGVHAEKFFQWVSDQKSLDSCPSEIVLGGL